MSEFVASYRKDLEEKIRQMNIEMYEITNCIDCRPDVKMRLRGYLYWDWAFKMKPLEKAGDKKKKEEHNMKIKIQGNKELKAFDEEYKVPEADRKYL